MVRRYLWGMVLALCLLNGALAATAAPAELPADQMMLSYVNAPDPTFKWEKGPVTSGPVTVTDILLTSQTWHGITWKHLLRVFKPAVVKHPDWLVMYITGGDGEPAIGKPQGEDMIGNLLSVRMQAPFAILYNVPNQPLFGGYVEDGMTTITFQKYLETGDPTWPAHFAMAKSAVKALDALAAFSKQEWGQQVDKFMLFGGSKRGWTTWLAAICDPGRVKAIAPAVIDTLNFPKQFEHQKEMFGHMSEAVKDFTDKGLTEILDTPRGAKLWASIDPYTFRAKLTMPKLIINAGMDPFWTTDALNLYWDDLVGPKAVLYGPNSSHNLATDLMGKVMPTLTAFFQLVSTGQPLPAMSWERKVGTDGAVTLVIKAPTASGARAWVAESETLDMRFVPRKPVEMTGANGVFTVTVPRPPGKNLAVFGEADFKAGDTAYTLSTQPVISRK